jgi:hypothetical protein
MSADEEKIESNKSLLLSGNFLIAIWIALGTASCYLISPLIGLIYFGFSAFSILIILRRQLCSTCYYCKSCTKGFAKLSLLFLGANHIPGIGKGSLVGMAAFAYIVLTVIPGALVLNSMLGQFSVIKLLALAGLLVISAYSFVIRIKNR